MSKTALLQWTFRVIICIEEMIWEVIRNVSPSTKWEARTRKFLSTNLVTTSWARCALFRWAVNHESSKLGDFLDVHLRFSYSHGWLMDLLGRGSVDGWWQGCLSLCWQVTGTPSCEFTADGTSGWDRDRARNIGTVLAWQNQDLMLQHCCLTTQSHSLTFVVICSVRSHGTTSLALDLLPSGHLG